MKRYTACSLIGAVFALVTLVVLTAVNSLRPTAYRDPFEGFDEVAPGQPTAVLAWGICASKYYFEDAMDGGFHCYIRIDDGPFELVTVKANDAEISSICFSASDLRVGDLVYRWGRPDSVQRAKGRYFLRWNRGIFAIANEDSWYTLEAPVSFVVVRKAQAWTVARI
jgi:hypothetical protein